MKRFLALTLWAVLFCPSVSISKPKEPTGSWSELKTQWEAYLSFPSPENFDHFVGTLKSLSGHQGNADGKSATLEYLSQNSGRLFGKVHALDPKAVDAAFLLLPMSSGEFRQKLNNNLGQLLSIDAKLFLTGLKQYRGQVSDLKALLTTLTDIYAKDPEAPENQRKLRIRVLQEVNEPALAGVRDECLKTLSQ